MFASHLHVLSTGFSPWTSPHASEQNQTGDEYAFGDTEEEYLIMTLGVPARGRQRDGPFNHATNKGWVKEQKGHYHDGIYVKKNNAWCSR